MHTSGNVAFFNVTSGSADLIANYQVLIMRHCPGQEHLNTCECIKDIMSLLRIILVSTVACCMTYENDAAVLNLPLYVCTDIKLLPKHNSTLPFCEQVAWHGVPRSKLQRIYIAGRLCPKVYPTPHNLKICTCTL